MKIFGCIAAFFAAFCVGAAIAGATHQLFLAGIYAILSSICFWADRNDKKYDDDQRRRRAMHYE